MSRRFVLLDRDGTINEEVDHLSDPGEVRLLPGAGAALRDLRAAGLGLVMITNQANVGRGLLSIDRLDDIHARLFELLRDEGAALDAVYVCPHAPEEGCPCRKPRTGLALRAAADHGFAPSEAFVVGDHAADMGLGRAIGATTLLVRTGHGEDELAIGAGADADRVVADLAEAASTIRDIVLARTPR
jgi:D-glycero-D-manno-heptose 1,7-bisphosphate phosphatase